MDKLVLTDTGGFPLKLDDLLWMDGRLDAANKGMYDAIQAHLLAYGTDYIVEGCTYSAPNVTAGWIMLASELMRVDASAGTNNYFVRTVTFDARGSKTFKDTTVNNTYEKIRGVLSGASGSLNITTALRLEDKIIQLLATSAEQFAAGNIPNLDASKITTGTFADARLPVATESAIGALEIATTAEAQALTATDKIITPDKLADVNAGLLTKIINIGDWDMDADVGVTVAHGLTATKIRNIKVLIISDLLGFTGSITAYFDFFAPANSGPVTDSGNTGLFITSSDVVLQRIDASFFDNASFNATSYNRGHITIEHTP